jgi:hypothetical protein
MMNIDYYVIVLGVVCYDEEAEKLTFGSLISVCYKEK